MFAAMEPPEDMSAAAIGRAKVELLQCVRAPDAARGEVFLGQFSAGRGERGYLDDDTVPEPESEPSPEPEPEPEPEPYPLQVRRGRVLRARRGRLPPAAEASARASAARDDLLAAPRKPQQQRTRCRAPNPKDRRSYSGTKE